MKRLHGRGLASAACVAGLFVLATRALAAPGTTRVDVPAAGASRGPADAAVTIVELADLSSAAGRAPATELEAAWVEHPGQLRHVVRFAPAPGDRSGWFVAMAAACATQQGRFWDFRRAALARPAPPSVEDLQALAGEAGLDAKAFERCLIEQRFRGRLEVDMACAEWAGVTRAPAFFVNGRRLGPDVAAVELRAVIEQEIASAPASPTARRSPPRRRRLDRAVRDARAFLATQAGKSDHSWLPVAVYLDRQYDARLRLADGRTVSDVAKELSRSEMGAIYARLVDAEARITAEQIAALPTAIDRATAAALHCQEHPLPADWLETLDELSRRGTYSLTHAALALEWVVENGCVAPRDAAPLREVQADLLVELASSREDLSALAVGDDIWLESLAMLAYIGQRSRVPSGAIDAVLTAQRRDGGWAPHVGTPQSHPHPTSLALWILLDTLHSGRRGPMVPRPVARR